MKERDSKFELLRILSMYMIVFIHANMYLGRFCEGATRVFFNGFVNGICNIGVTCFLLISGYFGITFNRNKLIKMECMMISYSFLELLLLYLVFPEQIQGGELLEAVVKACFPIISRKYWFYSCYVCLCLLSKWIDKFVDGLEQKEFQKFLLTIIVLFSVLPTVFYFEIVPDNGKGLVQMIMIYLIGRYIKMYGDVQIPKGKAILAFSILWLINGISHEIPIQIGGIYHHLCKDNSTTNIIMAVLLFYLFKEIRLKASWINKLSAYIFAVFALNNSLVNIVMHIIDKAGIPVMGFGGFGLLAMLVLFVFMACIAIGMVMNMVMRPFLVRVQRMCYNNKIEDL